MKDKELLFQLEVKLASYATRVRDLETEVARLKADKKKEVEKKE